MKRMASAGLAVALASGSLGIAACADGDLSTGRLLTYGVVVYGVVMDGSGNPVADALVSSNAFFDGCNSGHPSGSGSPTRVATDDQGRYRQEVVAGSDRPGQCVRVTAAERSGSRVSTAEMDVARLGDRNARGYPRDSVRIDVRLLP